MRCNRFTAIFILPLMLFVTACGAGTEAQSEGGLTKLTFVLDWTPNTNHTGLYAAIANGYFEEAGIEVEVVQPPEDGAELMVGSGKAQFGVSFQDYIAPALVGNDPVPITAVAAIVQHNTSGIISLADKGIVSPGRLEGKSYATWDLPVEKATLEHLMRLEGGDFSKVTLIPSTVTDEVSALSSGSVDAIWIFYAWAGVACEQAGLDTNFFAFADIDPVFDFYTPIVIANDDYLAENPDTSRAFLAALKKGYEFAAKNPREAADILMEAAPELRGSAELVYASQSYLADKYIADAGSWGVFDANRWAAFYTWLNDNELLEDGAIEPMTGFTNDYLPQ